MAEMYIRGGECFTDKGGPVITEKKFLGDARRSDEFEESGNDNISHPEEDDASSVSSLNESHPGESVFESDDEDDEEDEDERKRNVAGEQACGEGEKYARNFCGADDENYLEIEGMMQQLMIGDVTPVVKEDDDIYDVQIYGYYRESKGYGGYGIVIRLVNPEKNTEKHIGAYYLASKGGSYLYYLLMGVKRYLEIAIERRIGRAWWSINSARVVHYFNNIFRCADMLTDCFHSKRDVDDVNFCRRCCAGLLWLTDESFEILDPVIEDIIKLQFKTKFRRREAGDDSRSEAAYYFAKLGAKELEGKMKRGVIPDEVQEVEVKEDQLPPRLSTEKPFTFGSIL